MICRSCGHGVHLKCEDAPGSPWLRYLLIAYTSGPAPSQNKQEYGLSRAD